MGSLVRAALGGKGNPRRRDVAQLLEKMGWEPQDEGQRAGGVGGCR